MIYAVKYTFYNNYLMAFLEYQMSNAKPTPMFAFNIGTFVLICYDLSSFSQLDIFFCTEFLLYICNYKPSV